MPCAIFFAHKKDRGGIWAGVGLDNAIFDHIINDCCHGFFLGMRVAVRPWGGWKTVGYSLRKLWVWVGSVEIRESKLSLSLLRGGSSVSFVIFGIEKSAVRGPRVLNHSIPKTTYAPSMGNRYGFCGDMKVGCNAGLKDVVGATSIHQNSNNKS
ncbi:hypothetical protein A2U01_0007462, partial [Trifolium medium]|nr:hypothetical protein [Trifolium medium]